MRKSCFLIIILFSAHLFSSFGGVGNNSVMAHEYNSFTICACQNQVPCPDMSQKGFSYQDRSVQQLQANCHFCVLKCDANPQLLKVGHEVVSLPMQDFLEAFPQSLLPGENFFIYRPPKSIIS